MEGKDRRTVLCSLGALLAGATVLAAVKELCSIKAACAQHGRPFRMGPAVLAGRGPGPAWTWLGAGQPDFPPPAPQELRPRITLPEGSVKRHV
jgi:hypothetical protein